MGWLGFLRLETAQLKTRVCAHAQALTHARARAHTHTHTHTHTHIRAPLSPRQHASVHKNTVQGRALIARERGLKASSYFSSTTLSNFVYPTRLFLNYRSMTVALHVVSMSVSCSVFPVGWQLLTLIFDKGRNASLMSPETLYGLLGAGRVPRRVPRLRNACAKRSNPQLTLQERPATRTVDI